ncbi:hypothetical protein RAS1_23540 [Phycisphaerae bacterium RAS1]|nr:hypothetical protein RAS1_23540 [Phycisphaerae bacterium RAS1]
MSPKLRFPRFSRMLSRIVPRRWALLRAAAAFAVVLLVPVTDALGDDEAPFKPGLKTAGTGSPFAHILGTATFDTRRGRMLVYGGKDPARPDATPLLRSFDPTTSAWRTIDTRGPAPSGVAKPGFVYDAVTDAVYVFGGWALGADAPLDELWTLSFADARPGAWALVASEGPRPPARNGAVMLLHSSRRRIILHGGDGGPHPTYGFTPLDDLWTFDLNARRWSKLEQRAKLQPAAGAIAPQSTKPRAGSSCSAGPVTRRVNFWLTPTSTFSS